MNYYKDIIFKLRHVTADLTQSNLFIDVCIYTYMYANKVNRLLTMNQFIRKTNHGFQADHHKHSVQKS